MPKIAQRHIRSWKVVVPPLEEQKKIVAAIEDAAMPISKALRRTEIEISLVREYRTRLAADVVTGQVDVREAAARLPQEPRDEATEPIEDLIGDEGEPSEFEDIADSGTIGQE
jgi:type I restriction enzyme S subunit